MSQSACHQRDQFKTGAVLHSTQQSLQTLYYSLSPCWGGFNQEPDFQGASLDSDTIAAPSDPPEKQRKTKLCGYFGGYNIL